MMDSNVLSCWVFYNNIVPGSAGVLVNIISVRNEDDVDIWVTQPDLYMHLGFESMKEYMDSYPGNFDPKSDNMAALFGDTETAERMTMYRGRVAPNIEFSHFAPSDTTISNISIMMNNTLKYNDCKELIVTPTVSEVRTCAYFNTEKIENLWFCSDWGG